MPPPDCDPPYSNEHKHHIHFKESSEDFGILRAKISTLYADTLNHIQQKLRNTPGIHEVTTDRAGPHITLQLKGTTRALHQAQQCLERCFDRDFSLELDTTTYAETTNATHMQHQVTAHGTTGTPDKPAEGG